MSGAEGFSPCPPPIRFGGGHQSPYDVCMWARPPALRVHSESNASRSGAEVASETTAQRRRWHPRAQFEPQRRYAAEQECARVARLGRASIAQRLGGTIGEVDAAAKHAAERTDARVEPLATDERSQPTHTKIEHVSSAGRA